MTFHYSTFDKGIIMNNNTCRARDKAYPALSGLDFGITWEPGCWYILAALKLTSGAEAHSAALQFHREASRTGLGNFYQPQNFSS